jgi:hypothetical protein
MTEVVAAFVSNAELEKQALATASASTTEDAVTSSATPNGCA